MADSNNVDIVNQVIGAQSTGTTVPGQGYYNAVYLDVPFDLLLTIGSGAKRRIESCVLTGNEQIYDQSGSVLMDCYSFVGRRLR